MSTGYAQTKGQLLDEYTAALADYLRKLEEAPLERAYDIGRKCLTIHSLGIMDILQLHQIALDDAVRSNLALIDPATTFRRAARFLTESLAPFEMAHRAFREQVQQRTTELEALNRLFQQHLKERFASLEKYREVVGRIQKLGQEITGILDFAQDQDIVELRGQKGLDTILNDPSQAHQ